MWWRGGPCTRAFPLDVCLLYGKALCPALLQWLLLLLICTQMVRANTEGWAKTPASFRWLVYGEAGERGVEGPGGDCDIRTLKSTVCGLDDRLAWTDSCSLCLLLLTGAKDEWFWSLGAAALCRDMRSDKDGIANDSVLASWIWGLGHIGRLLSPRLLCSVFIVLALLSGLAVSCRPGTELNRSGLLLWCAWISSANEGLPPWPPTPGLLLKVLPTSTGLLGCQVLLRVPSGTGNDPAPLESCRARLLREQDRRLEAGLTEVRPLKLGGTTRPPAREIPERLEEVNSAREIFRPWAGLGHLCSCSASSWAREDGPAATGPSATQPAPDFGVNASFDNPHTKIWLCSLSFFASVLAKRWLRLYEVPDPGCCCVCFAGTGVTLLVLCGVERGKAPYLTRANRMQRESAWPGGGKWREMIGRAPQAAKQWLRSDKERKKAIRYSLVD